MSEYMTFELGLWNTWIGSVPLLALGFILMLANREVGRRLTDTSWYTASDRRFSFLSFFMMIALVVLSVWVPFRLGTYWFYIGSAIYLVSFAGYLTSFYNYAKTPQGQPVVRGVYRLSRNPLYFFYSTAVLGLCIASASVPFFIAWLLYNVPTHYIIKGEERFCKERYGKAYQEYMSSSPRYFLFF